MADDDTMKDYILEVKDICKEFPGVAALKNVSIQVKRGTVHALLGENGAGKSTLIKIISGVYCQTSGQIFVNGKKTGKMTPKTAMDLKIAVIHQELNLVPQMSVAENVFVGREMFPYIRQEVGEEVLRLENCSRKGVVKNISFSVKKGEVVGFAGLVGAGRSELARCIFGVDPFEQGKVYVEGEAIEIGSVKKAIEKGIYYTTENRKKDGIFQDGTVDFNMTISCLDDILTGNVIRKRKENGLTQNMKQKLLMKTPNMQEKIRNLSGGNQQKAIFARALLTHPKVMILDEPTRGIDVGAKAEIYRIICDLKSAGSAIVVISSELPELMGICDRILVMHEGELNGEFSREKATESEIMKCAFGMGVSL